MTLKKFPKTREEEGEKVKKRERERGSQRESSQFMVRNRKNSFRTENKIQKSFFY